MCSYNSTYVTMMNQALVMLNFPLLTLREFKLETLTFRSNLTDLKLY